MPDSVPACDEPSLIRPVDVQAAFDQMELAESEGASGRLEGHMGRKLPVLKAIAMFRGRVAKHPGDFRSMTVLGQLHIRLARENGRHAAYRSAENSLRDALELAPNYLTAKTWLAVALLAQHRFQDALELATEVVAENPRDTMALASMGDCEFHLGRIAAARKTYDRLEQKVGRVPAVLARQAQIAELNGNPDEAVTLLKLARDAVRQAGLASDSVAWYELRLAAVCHTMGDADQAKMHYRTVLDLDPGRHEAKTGLARLIAEQGDLELATQLLEETIEDSRSASAMMCLGDVLNRRGLSQSATAWYDTAEAILLQEMSDSGAAHQRDLSRFYSDRQLKVADALVLARQDLQLRSDVYAHDTLAWALYQNGQYEDAAVAILKAIKLGTRDAVLHYHAGMIHAAGGRIASAIVALRLALEINPAFDLMGAETVRRKLAELEAAVTTHR